MPPTDAILHDLEAVAASLLERHLQSSKEWFPHELVPWSQGREWSGEGSWSPDDTLVPAEVRSALFVNLLTEDNLPYYFRTIERVFGGDGPWGEWARRWTAEEGRHSIVIRDFLTVTRALDPWALERGRMAQVSGGVTPEPESPQDGFAYLTLQELATRVSHRNTGKRFDDAAGYDVMARVAADENLHFLFYRDLVSAALEVDASAMVLAIDRQVRAFEMPGVGIPDFTEHALAIARAGIYDFQVHHDQILQPVVVRQWRLPELEGLTPDANEARERVLAHIDRVARVGTRLAERRAAAVAS